MTNNDDRRHDILRKVRALIAQADGEEQLGNSAAADSFRAKADQLMTIYAIESFELEMSRPKDQRSRPEWRDIKWDGLPWQVMNPLRSLMGDLISHCRCRGVFITDGVRVVGYPADLDYLEILYTGLRLHMSANLRPQVSRELGYEASLAILKEAGQKWRQIYPQLVMAFPERFRNTVADVTKKKQDWETYQFNMNDYRDRYPETPWKETNFFKNNYIQVEGSVFHAEVPRPIGVRFTKEYTTYCSENGRERVRSDPEVYFRSFVQAYTSRISARLREQRQAQSEASTGKELVLSGLRESINELLWELFPSLRPHDPGCDCDSCHYCRQPKCQRPNCVAMRKPVRYSAPKETAISAEAYRRGRAAANTADLSGRGGKVGPAATKEIK